MKTSFATNAGGERPNEDYVVCGPNWAVVLDGATPLDGVDSGCSHDVPWLVRRLAAGIVACLLRDQIPLPDVLAEAIRRTRDAHARRCDLSNPDSPSSTVAIVRARDEMLDYLVLGDSPVILRRGQEVVPVCDDRADHLPGGRPYSAGLVRRWRNAPGGFWVASTSEQAAREALTGSAKGVTAAALLTDGVTRLVERYGATWAEVCSALEGTDGPAAVIRWVRDEERAAPAPPGKRHDDATAVLVSGIADR
jgi:serine/threonine protein phosphatase PrpC